MHQSETPYNKNRPDRDKIQIRKELLIRCSQSDKNIKSTHLKVKKNYQLFKKSKKIKCKKIPKLS